MSMYLEQCLFHTTYGDEWHESSDKHVVLTGEDYESLVLALRKADTPECRELARRLYRTHTGIRRCRLCGTMSYTTLNRNCRICAWCTHIDNPEWNPSPSTYGHPCRKPYRSKGE